MGDTPNFAVDNVAEMGSGTSDKDGGFRQVQDRGNSSVFDFDRHIVPIWGASSKAPLSEERGR